MNLVVVTNMLPLHESQPCYDEGACVTQWSYKACHSGPTQDGQVTVDGLTKHDPLEASFFP